METLIKFLVSIRFMVFFCNAYIILDYLENDILPQRRSFGDDYGTIIGVPSEPQHLPRSEPLLPGHTLLRPTFGMLKSALKYPHKEMDDGSGVYGNLANLGLPYDGKNERVLYSDFRRSPARYIMVEVPNQGNKNLDHYLSNRDFSVSSQLLDLEYDKNNGFDKLLSKLRAPKIKKNTQVYYAQVFDSDIENVLKQGLPNVENSDFTNRDKSDNLRIENSKRIKSIGMLLRKLEERTNSLKDSTDNKDDPSQAKYHDNSQKSSEKMKDFLINS